MYLRQVVQGFVPVDSYGNLVKNVSRAPEIRIEGMPFTDRESTFSLLFSTDCVGRESESNNVSSFFVCLHDCFCEESKIYLTFSASSQAVPVFFFFLSRAQTNNPTKHSCPRPHGQRRDGLVVQTVSFWHVNSA